MHNDDLDEFDDIGVNTPNDKDNTVVKETHSDNNSARIFLKVILCLAYVALGIVSLMCAVMAPMINDAGNAGPLTMAFLISNLTAPLSVIAGFVCVTSTKRPLLYFIPLYHGAVIYILYMAIDVFCDGKFTC